MSEPFVFDPRCSACKDPFGAVSCGTAISFHCRPLAKEGFTHCALVYSCEFAGVRREQELALEGPAGERVCFSGVLTASGEPDLCWYHFRLWRDDGTGCILDRTGYRSDGGLDPWQLTIYQKNDTPEWFGSGVTYQIFPDRFCRLTTPNPAGLIGRRWVHQDWDDTPEWRPDPDGEIRNRDFFGGQLAGITSKLDYLKSLGVTTIYLCPIFESASNHRYNTADYTRIDPMLGTEEDFRELCAQAKARGMRILLDGVFNHTGSQSIYFNADGYYPTLGAYQSKDSPWYSWYRFYDWPDSYDSWWGIYTLPAVEESAPSYVDFIIDSPDSVIRRWLRAGASGWRLDVADELPDWFLEKIRAAMDETAPGSVLIGEVWEDGSNKISYSQRRRYLLGRETHGLMNYPFRTALLSYLQGGDANDFREAMETLRENYPPDAFYSAMNFLGTHDTPRILTLLSARETPADKGARAAYRLLPWERAEGTALLCLAALVLFSFPGSPMIYYGDEAGMEGFEDPLNRGTFPWGQEDATLMSWFSRLGGLRCRHTAWQRGSISWLYTGGPLLAFAREDARERLVTVTNASHDESTIHLPWSGSSCRDLLSGQTFSPQDGALTLDLPPFGCLLLQ